MPGPYVGGVEASMPPPASGGGGGGGLGAGGIIAGGAIGALGGLASSWLNNRYASREADKARAWSERMANTAYQRQVADMRAAGLNPIMAAMKGGGADTPSSPSPSGSPPDLSGPGSAAKLLALDKPRVQSEIALNSAQTQLAREAADVKGSEYYLNSSMKDKVEAERRNLDAMTAANVEVAHANAALARSSARRQDVEAQNILDTKGKSRFESSLYDVGSRAFDWVKGQFMESPSGVYQRGHGNVYGGKNSAKE